MLCHKNILCSIGDTTKKNMYIVWNNKRSLNVALCWFILVLLDTPFILHDIFYWTTLRLLSVRCRSNGKEAKINTIVELFLQRPRPTVSFGWLVFQNIADKLSINLFPSDLVETGVHLHEIDLQGVNTLLDSLMWSILENKVSFFLQVQIYGTRLPLGL